MRQCALSSDELGAALKIRTQRRVIDVQGNGSGFPWFPEGLAVPLGVDRNDRPRHLCEEERTIRGFSLVFPVVFYDAGTDTRRGPEESFRPYWIEWMAIHTWMPMPDQGAWRDGTILEGVNAVAQTPEVGSLRCHDYAWHQTSGQVYLLGEKLVVHCGGSGSFHHQLFGRPALCPCPPRELVRY